MARTDKDVCKTCNGTGRHNTGVFVGVTRPSLEDRSAPYELIERCPGCSGAAFDDWGTDEDDEKLVDSLIYEKVGMQQVKRMVTEDTLQTIFDLQERLMRELQTRTPDGIPPWPLDMSTKPAQRFIRDTLSKSGDELFEARYMLKLAKEHRNNTVEKLDRDELLEEMVDALHFFVEACIMIGVGPNELFDAYKRKNTKNLQRIDDEFGTTKTERDDDHTKWVSQCCESPVDCVWVPRHLSADGDFQYRCMACGLPVAT